MADAWSGESLINQSSLLTGKLGELVASPLVTLVDDGTLARRLGSSPYDGEGLATRRNVLLDRGRLAMFAYDHYHARRAGLPPTANALRGWSSTPGIGFHNLSWSGRDSPGILRQVGGLHYDDGAPTASTASPVTVPGPGLLDRERRAFPVDGDRGENSLEMLRHRGGANDLGGAVVACPAC
jgi:hypothetical protein